MAVLFLSLLFLSAVTGYARAEVVCREIEGCTADIAILVDKSGSIIAPEDGGAPGNWRVLKDLIYNIMTSSNYGTPQDKGALYSVLFFANNANLKVKFNDCSDLDCVKNIIEALNPPGGKTNTDAALQMALNTIFTAPNGDRPDAPDIIIVLTDGKPNPHNEAQLNATVRAVKGRNIRVIGIGVGKGVDNHVMREIVTAPASENYFQIQSFAAIAAELDNILRKACIVCEELPCYNDWSEWSSCSTTCEVGVETRTRAPRGQEQCEGPSSETRNCAGPPCECYGPWGEWSFCSVSCGSGFVARYRSPLGERRCEEPDTETQACTQAECPCYGEWGEWGVCSASCGGGNQMRQREKLSMEPRCEGRTDESRSCNEDKCPGCDPATVNFYKEAYAIKGYERFEEEWLLGSWYGVRWYLSPSQNVSSDVYDRSFYAYKKAGHPDDISATVFGRDKMKQCCDDRYDASLTRIGHGLYQVTLGDVTTGISKWVYGHSRFLVQVVCYGPNHETESCSDYRINFWSKCKHTRLQDNCKGEDILKKLCYPDMKRFICTKHEIDCHESPMGHDQCEPPCEAKKKCNKCDSDMEDRKRKYMED